jgi:hypothetical protein
VRRTPPSPRPAPPTYSLAPHAPLEPPRYAASRQVHTLLAVLAYLP